jgi:hypothetical protein
MSQQQVKSIKPFLSIALLMCFLFIFAFIKMENRRLGYSFMKLAQKEKHLRNKQKEKSIQLTRMMGPERVQLLATQRLPMKKAGQGQIIQMTGDGVAIIQ